MKTPFSTTPLSQTPRSESKSNPKPIRVTNPVEDAMNRMIPMSPMVRRAAGVLAALFVFAAVWSATAAPGSTPSTTAIASSQKPSTYGTAVNFTATVSGGSGVPTGTVQFRTNGVNFGGAVTLSPAGIANSTTTPAKWPVGTYTVDVVYSGDDVYAASSATLAGGQVVNRFVVTATATGIDKTYDSSTNTYVNLELNEYEPDQVYAYETKAYFTDKNVGIGKTVVVTGIYLTGADSANYQLASTTTTTTADIIPAILTYTADPKNKAFGDPVPALTGTVTGFVGADTPATALVQPAVTNWTTPATVASLPGQYPINGSGLQASNGNYIFINAPANSTALTVGQKPLTVAITVSGKVYDGTADATILTRAITAGLVPPDDTSTITLSGGTATFTSKNVGLRSAAVTGLVLGGANAANYVISSILVTPTNITPATLTYVADPKSRVYGAGNPALTGSVIGWVPGEIYATNAVTGATNWTTPATPTSNVGSYAITGSGLAAENYVFAQAAANATALTITKASVIPSVTASDKPYDGTINATISGRSLEGVLFDDEVNLGTSGTASFADPAAGVAKPVSVTGLALFGTKSGNYTLSTTTASTTASITPKALTMTADSVNKVYDGTNTATLANVKVSGILPADVSGIGPTNYTATFPSKNVGTNLTVTVTNLSVGGSMAGNYAFSPTFFTKTANISVKSLTVDIVDYSANKEYDGTTNATPTLSSDKVSTDTNLVLNYARAGFLNSDIGNNKTVRAYTITKSGSDAPNYSLANTTAEGVANITKRQITIIVDNKGKCQGDADPTFTCTTNGTLLSGHTMTVTLSRVPGEAPGNYAINASYTITPNFYTVTVVPGTLTIYATPTCNIVGPPTMPQNTLAQFSYPGMTSWAWSVVNGTIVGAATNQTVTVQSGGGCSNSLTVVCTAKVYGCVITCTKTVSVPDTTPPVVTSIPDATWECNSMNPIPNPTALDACNGTNVTWSSSWGTVTEVSTNNWGTWTPYTQSGGTAGFVEGPGTAPLATGSAQLRTPVGWAAAQLESSAHNGTSLVNVTELNYRAYRTSGLNDNQVYIILLINNGSDPELDSLVFEPKYQNGANPALPVQGPIVDNAWKRWDALIGGWWSENHPEIASPGVPAPDNAGVKLLSAYLDVYPNSTIAGIIIAAGNYYSGWENFVGAVDALVVGVNSASVAYNFENISGLDCVALKIKELKLQTWTVADAAGNKRDSSRIVIVKDTIPPVFTAFPADLTVQCDAVPAPAGAVAVDVCSPTVTVTNVATSTQDTNVANVGHYNYTITRMWTATDPCGNATNRPQVITVRDTQAPAIAWASGQGVARTVECGVPLQTVFDVPAGTDNCTPSDQIVLYNFDSPTPGVCPGYYTVRRDWYAMDVAGNFSAAISQTVTVVDTTAPTVPGLGDMTVECHTVPARPTSVNIIDACDPNPLWSLAPDVNTQGPTNTLPGFYSYTITRVYTLWDSCKNTNVINQVITVRDTTKPTLTWASGQGKAKTNECPAANMIFDRPVAHDNCSPDDLLVVSSTDETFAGTCPGRYQVRRKWTATDVAGITSNPLYQTNYVVDTTKPVVTCPANMTVACAGLGLANVVFNVTATDACDAAPTVICNPPSGSAFNSGHTTPVTCYAVDSCSNTSAAPCTFTVTVVDRTGPIMSVADAYISSCAESTSPTNTGYPTVSDACGSSVVSTNYVDVTTLEICPATPDGWSFVTGGTGQGFFTNGPASPPLPTGSAQLQIAANGFAALQSGNWNGVFLTNITELRYSTYINSASPGSDVNIALVFYVDNTGDGTYDDILYFAPKFQTGVNGTPVQPPVILGNWQSWDAYQGAWWSQNNPQLASPGPGAKSLATYASYFGGATRIVNPPAQGGVALQAGTPTGDWENYSGNVDRFVFGTNGVSTTFDFESTPGVNCGSPVFASGSMIRVWTAVDQYGNVASLSQAIFIRDTGNPVVTSPTNHVVQYAGCDLSVLRLPYSPVYVPITLAQFQAEGYTATDSCSAVTILYKDIQSLSQCPIVVDREYVVFDVCGNYAPSVAWQTNIVTDAIAPVVTLQNLTLEGCNQSALTNLGPNLSYSTTPRLISETEFRAAGGSNAGCGVGANAQEIPIYDTLSGAKLKNHNLFNWCDISEVGDHIRFALGKQRSLTKVTVRLTQGPWDWTNQPYAHPLTLKLYSAVNPDTVIASRTVTYTFQTSTNTQSGYIGYSVEFDFTGVIVPDTIFYGLECLTSKDGLPAGPYDNLGFELWDVSYAGDPALRDGPVPVGFDLEGNAIYSRNSQTDPYIVHVGHGLNLGFTPVIQFKGYTVDSISYVDSAVAGSCPMTITRTFTVKDFCNNTTVTNQSIVIQDLTPPVATVTNLDLDGCDVNTTLASGTGLPYSPNAAPVTPFSKFAAAGGYYYDACGLATLTYQDGYVQGNCSNKFVVTRTFILKDPCNNVTVVSQTINISDKQLPTLTASGSIAAFYKTLAAAIQAATNATTAADNCTVASSIRKSVTTSGDCMVTLSVFATDACGNVSTNDVKFVTLVDGNAPTITVPANISTNTVAGICESPTLAIGTATAWDNCSTNITITGYRSDNVSLPLNGTYPKGVTTITWWAEDQAGNRSTNATQKITVLDTEYPAFPPGNAISWWQAENTAKDAVDSNHGTLMNGATYAAGKFGSKAFSLDGIDDYVQTPTAGLQFGTNDFTVAGWVKTTDNGSWNTLVSFGAWQTPRPFGWAAIYLDAAGVLQFNDGINGFTTTASGFNDNAWHHFAVVREAGVITMYKDGVSRGAAALLSTNVVATTNAFFIGADPGDFFAGSLDEIGIFGRALTATEIGRFINGYPALGDIVAVSAPGTCGTNVSWIAPIGVDNCANVTNTLTTTPANGAQFPVGTNTVIYRARDASGNDATCSFRVIVLDTTPPYFTNWPAGFAITTNTSPRTDCAQVVTYTAPGGTDQCGGSTVARVAGLASGALFPVGKTTNVFVITDAAGNTATTNFVVTVVDNTKPTLVSKPDSMTVYTGPGRLTCNAPATWTPPVATDCSVAGGIVTNWTSTRQPGDVFPVGTTTVTYTGTDAYGNTVTASFDVTVRDNTPPMIANCPSNIIATVDPSGTNCQATVTWTPPLANDNCVVISFTSTHTPGSKFPVGTTLVTYTAQDPAGNVSTCSFNVTVADSTAPVIVGCPTDITVSSTTNCSAVATWTEPTTVDSCSTATITSTNRPGDVFPVGTNVVTYTARDTSGNSATCLFKVIVVNNTGPTFVNFPADVSVQCPGESIPAATPASNLVAVANCGGPVVITNIAPVTNVVSGCLKRITNSYAAIDQFNNVTVRSQVVTVGDTIAPTVVAGAIPACSTTLVAAEAAAIAATTATDNCSTNLTKRAITAVTNCQYTIRVVAKDACDNETAEAQAAVYVTRIDPTPPTIDSITATQNAADVKNCAAPVLQGEVLIAVAITEDCGGLLPGASSITLTNGASTQTAAFVNESPAGTLNYRWTVTSLTANGTWYAKAVMSSCQSATATFTLCVDNSQIVGSLVLEDFAGTGTNVNHSRLVTFVATTNSPTAGTNVLKVWNLVLTNASGNTFNYRLLGVPPTVNGLSAKTAWNLRSKLPVTLVGGQASGVDFVGAKQLRGGDYSGPPSTMPPSGLPDNAVSGFDYNMMGYYWLTTNPKADGNGDGTVNSTDYFLLYFNWFTSGDPE